MATIPYSSYSVDEVIELHRQLIDRYGGPKEFRPKDRDGTQGALGAACQASYLRSADGECNTLHLASGLLYYFAVNQIFVDGNKRVGLAMCINFLYSENLALASSQAEVYAFVNRIAGEKSGRPTLDDVIAWVGDPERLIGAGPPSKHPLGTAGDLFDQKPDQAS